MSVNLINKTINDLGIDSLEIFYDFSSYSGGFINSIESGNSLYSGEIIEWEEVDEEIKSWRVLKSFSLV